MRWHVSWSLLAVGVDAGGEVREVAVGVSAGLLLSRLVACLG